MATSKLRVTELDFDSIKTNLKAFFKDQSEFTDYDFDGSGLSLLLDVLAYNTHYMAFYLNMVANEMYLDSATQRDSVISLAKNLGYTPRSKTGATAILKLDIVQNSAQVPDFIKIPAYTQFNVTSLGKSYTFYSLEDKIVSWTGSAANITDRTFNVENFSVSQGSKLIKEFVVTGNTNQRFLLENVGIDTSTISLRVKENANSNTYESYKEYDGLLALNSASAYYFVTEAEGQTYEISFGDGVYGKKVSAGNVVIVEYLTTDGIDANGLTGLALSSESQTWGETSGQTTASVAVTVTTTTASGGGGAIENLDSIKFLAPRSFQHQNRAVTVDDYKAILKAQYSNIDSLRVWGGDEDYTGEFGTVFIAIKPVEGEQLTKDEINKVQNILKDYKVVGMETKISSPEYVGLKVSANVKYNPTLTSEKLGTIQYKAVQAIKNWNKTVLGKFDGSFRYSQLVAAIDDADKSIISNASTISVVKTSEELVDLAPTLQVDLTDPEEPSYYYYTKEEDGKIPTIKFKDNILKSSFRDREGSVEDKELITIEKGGFESTTFRVLARVKNDPKFQNSAFHELLAVKIIDVPNNDKEGILKIVTIDDKDIEMKNFMASMSYAHADQDVFPSEIGTILYEKGELKNWKEFPIVSAGTTNTIDFMGKVKPSDIIPEGKQILLIKDAHINIDMEVDFDK